MKINAHPSIVLGSVLLLASILTFAGCAGRAPAKPGQTLAAAGFRLRTPETPQQKEIFAKLEGGKVEKLTVKGQTFYIYKDAEKGVAMVGREAEYQRYRQMKKQDQGGDYYTATVMDDTMARNWSTAYGLNSDWR